MKLIKFIKKLDDLGINKEYYGSSAIDCVAYIPRKRSVIAYPITSITTTSTHKGTKVILNAEYETLDGRNCIKLDQLYEELKYLQSNLDIHERKSSIFMNVKKSKNAPNVYYTIPIWGHLILDMNQEALFIKCTNSFISKD